MSWKTPITLLVLLGVLLGAGYYGWRTIISPATGDAGSTNQPHHHGTHCAKRQAFHKGQKFKSKDIIVNVYNAGAIPNLAGDTLAKLGAKGFKQGVADNAPSGVGAANVTILTSDRRLPQVQLVASQFKGRVTYTSGPALAAGIDVIVGDSFVGADPSARKYLTLHHAISTCKSQGRAR